MSVSKLDIRNRREFLNLLIAGEILTRRSETGPLARLWIPIDSKKRRVAKKRGLKDPEDR